MYTALLSWLLVSHFVFCEILEIEQNDCDHEKVILDVKKDRLILSIKLIFFF